MGCFLSCLGGPSADEDEMFDNTNGRETVSDFRARLSEAQAKALDDAVWRAKEASAATHPVLIERCQKLGFDQEDVQTALRYFRDEAPMIIHFDPQQVVKKGWFSDRTVLDNFLADTHYRSVFETRVTGSNMADRDHKERMLFQGLYHQGSAPGERPKYGSVNLYEVPWGTARTFGECYFVLRAHIRACCTLT